MKRIFWLLILITGLSYGQNPIDDYLIGVLNPITIGTISDGVDKPRDLDFHPTRENELWVLNQGEDAYDNNSNYVEYVCVPENTNITFTIFDSYGDGICCSWGIGSYQVSGCGNTYASGGNFGSSESTSFTTSSCESSECDADEIELVIDITTDNYASETSWEVTNTVTDEMYGFRGEPGGSTVLFFAVGQESQVSEYRKDVASSHFMNTASSLSFDNQGYFANSIDCKDGNNNPTGYFAGPTLWDADLSVYAQTNQNGSGSHIDMLHQSPWGVGIEWAGSGNIYWVFDGHHSAIVRYDFRTPHAYGGDNHADGRVWRYGEESVDREPGVSSHMVLDELNGWLYIADTGNSRISRFNVNSGDFDYNLSPYGEPLNQYWMMENAEWEVIISDGLQKPSGIDFYEDRLVVGDYQTGELIIYDIGSDPVVELGRIETGFSNNLMGIKIDSDQYIWYVNFERNEVIKLEVLAFPGDINFDSVVNILDIILEINIILGDYDANDQELAAADLNNDGEINILDIIALVNIILDS